MRVGDHVRRAFLGPVSWRKEMRRLLGLATFLLVLPVARPAGAESIVDRQPMDLGSNQAGTLNDMGQDLVTPAHRQTWWFDAGVSYPVSQLHKDNIRPGMLVRVNHQIWERDALGVVGSAGVLFGDDSYANDIANEWPQYYEPRPGAHEKDEIENWLHGQVCDGKMSLAEAQAAKNDALCRKLRLQPSDHVLEIGTGWGGCRHEREEVHVFVGVTRYLQGLNSTERKDNRHTAGGERHILPSGEASACAYEVTQNVARL